jgi:hypothetical protein
MPLAEKDRHDLRRAVAYLEKTGWLMRFTNLVFTSHFQRVARGHFIVRRLERVYGREAVKSAYEAIRSNPAGER